MTLKARFAKEVGTRAFLRVYWGNSCIADHSYHNAELPLTKSIMVGDWKLGGEIDAYPDERWPTKCDRCSVPVSEDAKRQVSTKRLYNTPSGKLEPGDLYWADWFASKEGEGCTFHDNCDGTHLHAILPNGRMWDIDGRASNCTKKEERSHRCWVRTGEPPNVDVGKGKKGSDTCAAGAGSIASGSYHGFLRNGVFT